MHFDYKTKGTCATVISLDMNDGVVSNVKFRGGCPGNLMAIPQLVEGMSAEDIEKKLAGINCGGKGTSCADQLARACHAAYLQEQAGK